MHARTHAHAHACTPTHLAVLDLAAEQFGLDAAQLHLNRTHCGHVVVGARPPLRAYSWRTATLSSSLLAILGRLGAGNENTERTCAG